MTRLAIALVCGLTAATQIAAADTAPTASNGSSGAGGAVDVKPVLARIAAARDGLKSWRAGFVQERTIGLLATKIRSHGQVVLVRPDRLRWQLDPPDAATYWVGPNGVAYTSPNGHGSVPASERKVSDAMSDLNALLGGDLARLGDRYLLTAQETPAEVSVTATAKDPSHGLRGFVLAFAPSDLGSPTHATLLEAGKDRSEITFEHAEKNPAVDPALMKPDF